MKSRDRPAPGRLHYLIEPNDDGTVNVYLDPRIVCYDTDTGIREYDRTMRVVRGVAPWHGMIDDIKARYDAWCESGEQIAL